MLNENLINSFTFLAKYYHTHRKVAQDAFRANTYNKVLKAIREYPEEITSPDQLKGIKGVGKKSLEKVREILETGTLRTIDKLKAGLAAEGFTAEHEQVLEDLQKIHGVSKVGADKLWDQGIRSIEDLRKRPELLKAASLIGLKYYDEITKPIPRRYIDILRLAMHYALSKEYGMDSYKMVIAGSYRRGKPTSGDIDCLATSKVFDLADMVKTLKEYGIITDTLSMGKTKFMGIAHCPAGGWFHVRLDIEFVTKEEEWGPALVYFTGSKDLQVTLRTEAKKRGLSLNQHGLFDGARRLPYNTEREVFEALGMEYLPPEKR